MNKNSVSSVRIIAGKYKGRKIFFKPESGLRPTHDRIRETLFNWLQADVQDAVCLDFFAGSGALGFEALSRGAKQVCFVDNSTTAIGYLNENIQNLAITNANTYLFDFMKSDNPPFVQPFDIIFLDPPFQQSLFLPALKWLVRANLLKTNTLIYLEVEKGGVEIEQLSEKIEIIRHKTTKSLEYLLLTFCDTHRT